MLNTLRKWDKIVRRKLKQLWSSFFAFPPEISQMRIRDLRHFVVERLVVLLSLVGFYGWRGGRVSRARRGLSNNTTGTHVLLLHTNTSGKKEKVFYQSLVEFFIHAIHVHYSRNSPFTMIHCVTATPVYCSTPLIDQLGLLFGTCNV